MSRWVVVSHWQPDLPAAEGYQPDELFDLGPDDKDLAERKAMAEAKSRLNELEVKFKNGDRDSFPWKEQIIVCPKISGIGRGGGDYLALGDRTLCITVGFEC